MMTANLNPPPTRLRATAELMTELHHRREPFVHATVVRAQAPASARAGDEAVVLADGSITGFVGGQCAAGSVKVASLEALATGQSILLRILPDGSEQDFPETPGALTVVNPCLSGGAMEIFLKPVVPSPVIQLSGDSPVSQAIRALAPVVGFSVSETDSASDSTAASGAIATVLASHGGAEAKQIRAALDAGVPLIALVASRRRGAAVLAELDLTDDERARVQTPAGLDIGAKTAEEVALSILAGVVKAIRQEGAQPAQVELETESSERLPAAAQPVSAAGSVAPATAVDPVCGMTVLVGADTPHLLANGEDVWFCCPGCRDKYAAQLGAE